MRVGDFLKDAVAKLTYVRDYCNEHDARCLIGGDIFDKPSVPDEVKNAILPILRSFKYMPFAIFGNHDIAYNNEGMLCKTSYQTLVGAGCITPIDGDYATDFIGSTEVTITNVKPIMGTGKPTIAMFHAFLNQDDGVKWSVYTTDLLTATDETLVLLGHDHGLYEDVEVSNNVKVIRPGSLLRVSRDQTSQRTPCLIDITLVDGKWHTKRIDIPSKAFDDAFLAKADTPTASEVHATYEDVIKLLSQSTTTELTFVDALGMVTTEEVTHYIQGLLQGSESKSQIKINNL